MVAKLGDDGTFLLPVEQAAMDYVALLMTPAFAQQYVASTFPDGTATVQALPLPVDNPGQVILMAVASAGLDRSLLLGMNPDYPVIPALPPGKAGSTSAATPIPAKSGRRPPTRTTTTRPSPPRRRSSSCGSSSCCAAADGTRSTSC